MTVIGEYNPDGTTKTEVDECAISGQPVLGQHSILQRIKDTPYFYRYMSDYQHRLTPEKQAEIEALADVSLPSSDAFAFKHKGKSE